jgi:hypothetical protein
MLRRSVVVAGFAAWISALFGGPYLVTSFGVDEGLPQSSVMDVAQTPDGYLWIGTLMGGKLGEAGKWSWDFVSLPDAMPDPRCQQDRAGSIWYLRSDRTLGRWANGAFERIALEADLPGHQPRLGLLPPPQAKHRSRR